MSAYLKPTIFVVPPLIVTDAECASSLAAVNLICIVTD
jgi:hypothetical protein